MRAIIAGGGTGGHVIPALAFAQELRREFAAEVLFIGTARGLENRLVPQAGFPLRLVEVGALKHVSLETRLKTLLELPRAIAVSGKILMDFRPQVVLGVGGYASGPAMLAAALGGIPTLVFEPNFVPGFANRLVAPMVTAAAIHFPESSRWFRRSRVTGVPVRREFFDLPPRSATDRPTLLLFGGSQGAHALNMALTEALPALGARLPELHIIHQTGERDYAEAQAAYLKARVSAEVYPFIEDMPGAFARSDVLVCRSGASTVAEVTAAGKPTVFVPFPHAADQHQLRNAEALAKKDAALLIEERELNAARLVEVAAGLLGDRPRLGAMASAARALSHPHAAHEIAQLAAQLAGIAPGS
jgi:UDP-N-acetylglucosamine--N-acetylmuramyl-(pentapeptide) pyrophosphoryl-undecaprenol N-acetylglucosamine transferase